MNVRNRMPAEWEPHRAVWLAWPTTRGDWAANLAEARLEWAALCRAVAERGGETVEVLVRDERAADEAAAAIGSESVRFHRARYGDVWLRDSAPTFVRDADRATVAACFRFNGWGGRYPDADDEALSRTIAGLAGVAVGESSMVFEGGALDTDGLGTAIVGRASVLNANRNPNLDAASAEAELRRVLGLENVIWLDAVLAEDHTDGHTDTLARFVAPGRVLCMEPACVDDPNAEVLDSVYRTLADVRDGSGRRIEVVRVPSPGRVEDATGELLPASYMNFYIANEAVVVPVYGAPNDRVAVDRIAECFPDRATIALPAIHIVSEGGAFHCLTQQELLCTASADSAESEPEAS